MPNELSIDINQIMVTPGSIIFNDFEVLKGQALQLSEHITQVEVTDENIQSSKKLLAAVNKRVKEMEDSRINIKKEMLAPYNEFEKQVKEIVMIVKGADGVVRQQVRDLEEREREEKQRKIEELFKKRIVQYSFENIFDFGDFIKPQHLNKSSMKSIETEMVEWLEKKDADMKVIKSLPNSHDVLMEYLDTKDLSIAINIVNDREERKKQIEQVTPIKETTAQTWEQSFIITLSDIKDLKLVEMFMQQNNINYKSEKVAK